ncbi:MAG: RNA polymerase sigma factor [Lachnospiraceae bacterium]|nr:RNA polymerase sigma factor [Lachnospiraceae bacterium]
MTITTQELEQLANTYGDSIYGFCLHLTGHPEYAEDLYQDTFLKAIEIRHKIKTPSSEQDWLSAKNYVIGIAIRLWKKTISKKGKHAYDITLEDCQKYLVYPDELASQMEKKELYHQLYRITGNLPDKLKIVIHMHYFLEMNLEEIASVLRIPKGTVKSRLFLARKQISKEMEEMGYEISI